MSTELFLAFLGFAFATLITPGPNNLMLLASGANFGLKRTLPHMLGIAIGFGVMVVLVGTGLMVAFDQIPALYSVLKVVSVVFLLWLAWKIAHAAAPGSSSEQGRPLRFIEAAAFQWVNPKAWPMALSAVAAYAPDRTLAAVGVLALTFCVIALGTGTAWMSVGRHLRRWLAEPARLRVFNWTMAALLVATLVPVLFA